AHQVPLADVRKNPEQLRVLEDWMRAQNPEQLFDADGRLLPELKELAPTGSRRMGAHHETFERRHAHRGVDGLARTDRSGGTAVPEVERDDVRCLSSRSGQLAVTKCDVAMRGAVEAVAPDPVTAV